jgi:pimeloyl-ACP methyl ester carboxylesterase
MKRWMLRVLKRLGAPVLAVAALVLFNYLRHFVIWAPTEAAQFTSEDGTVIRGTLVRPSDSGAHPAIVMLHGSGPENIYGFDYRTLANAFARKGFAVLLYDKRGVGESDGDFSTATYRDFVLDAIAATNFLAEHPAIDADNIGIHAVSEGAWFAPEVVYRTGQISFVVNKVGPPSSWMDTVIWEVENELLAAGVPAAEIGPLLEVTLRRWQYYVDTGVDPSLAEGPERASIEAEMQRIMRLNPAAATVLPDKLVPYDEAEYARISANFGYDPGPYLQSIDVPMIYLYGTDDVNIPTMRSVRYLEMLRDDHDKPVDIVVYEGVGHPLMSWTGALEGGYVPGYLDRIGTWSADQVVR